ncbi:MAG: hypothetical protein ACKO2P_10280 [Planctomycetota bacterium]
MNAFGGRADAVSRRLFCGAAATGLAGGAVVQGTDESPAVHSVTLRAGDLEAVIGDNAAEGVHRAGYNGVWSLKHRLADRSLFVPGIAGLNLEHIVNGTPLDTDELFFEPRRAAMTLQSLSDTAVRLHQPATFATGVESSTVFRLSAPNVLDMHFECVPRKPGFPHGYLSLFWASYMQAPADKSMYFLGGQPGQPPAWTQLCTQFHNDQSTVRHRSDEYDAVFDADQREALFRNFSRLRFDAPFFYGHFGPLMWVVLFDRSEGIRLTHSPSGGGFDSARRSSNPAWDFQFLIRNPEVNQARGFAVRTILCPAIDRELLPELAVEWQREVRGR